MKPHAMRLLKFIVIKDGTGAGNFAVITVIWTVIDHLIVSLLMVELERIKLLA